MGIDFLILLAGLVLLYFGAEWLVGGSSSIALRFGVTPLIVGLTFVAFGTSAPELVVSVTAALKHADDISVGNIVGSNIANLTLILGAAAVTSPLDVESTIIRREYPVMFAVTVLLVVLAMDGKLSQVDGLILVAAMGAYVAYMFVIARMEMNRGKEMEFDELEGLDPTKGTTLGDVGKIVIGIIGLVGGAHLMVTAASSIASAFGVPQMIIAISIVAIGTSLPELATSVVAARHGKADMAVGNAVGSNVFNSMLVLGAASVLGGITVGAEALRWDLWVMLGVTLLVWPILWTGKRIRRWEGVLLLVFYASYMTWLYLR